jgi:hypothetical protein
MELMKYNLFISTEGLEKHLMRLTNQIYKLLPSREEGLDWERPLEAIIEELAGLNRLMENKCEESFLPLCSKLEGLFTLTKDTDFLLFRSTVFKCLGLMGDINNYVKS